MSPNKLVTVTQQFLPGVTILYGTFVSLTLNVLYARIQKIQSNAAIETSLIAYLSRNILTLFADAQDQAIVACQCIADEIITLAKSTRGKELMNIMYSDPYARLLEILSDADFNLIHCTEGIDEKHRNHIIVSRITQ